MNGYLEKFPANRQKWLLEGWGQDFYKYFLMVRGGHCLVIGNTGSGKTQKGLWLASWLCEMPETIIWIDSGKQNEYMPLLDMGKPVRILHPIGTSIEIRNVPESLQIDTVAVETSSDTWRYIRKEWVNILMFRNRIADEKKRSLWMLSLFKTLAEKTRRGTLKHIYPCSIFIDEAQWLIGSKKISTKSHRIALAEEITELILEHRAYGSRIILITQGFRNITGASRENMPTMLLCRGCKREWFDNAQHKRFADYTMRYTPDKGLFVFSDGHINPTTGPWSFKFYEPQSEDLIVNGTGFWDEQPDLTPEQIAASKALVSEA